MWKQLMAALLPVMAAGCAGAPAGDSPAARWSAYQSEVLAQRERGTLSATQAVDAERKAYQALFGADPDMDGAFAYSRSLYAAADAGRLPVAEADLLSQARVEEIEARRRSGVAFHEEMVKRFPPPDVYD